MFFARLPNGTPACSKPSVYPQQPIAKATAVPTAAKVKLTLSVALHDGEPYGTFWVESLDDLEDADLLVERGIYIALDQCLPKDSKERDKILDTVPYYARYQLRSIDSRRSVVDLRPGMRIRLDRGSIAFKQPAYGVGSVWFDVVGDGARGVMISAATRVHDASPPDSSGVVVGSIPGDVNPSSSTLGETPARKYLRLIIPKTIPPTDSDLTKTVNRGSNFVFLSGDDREVADGGILDSDTPDSWFVTACAKARCVLFPGHTQAIVEIPIVVQTAEVYVPLGTTLGDVVSRQLGGVHIYPKELTELMRGRLSVKRQLGAESVRVDLPLDTDGWQQLPLAQGDRVAW